MAPDDTRPVDEVEEADRRNGEAGPDHAEGDAQLDPDLDPGDLDHDDAELDQHPEPGKLPSDTDVQAERQEPLT